MKLDPAWFRCALVRAAKTFCQSLAAGLSAAAVLSDIDWRLALSSAVLAALLSLLTSLAGLPEVDRQQ